MHRELVVLLYGRALGWFPFVFNLILNDLTSLKHPEKSSIFRGTRLIPLSFEVEGEGECFVRRGYRTS
jgi:hypothetical protein